MQKREHAPKAAKVPPLEVLIRPRAGVFFGIDPGETTGFAVIRGAKLITCTQLDTGRKALRDGSALHTLRGELLSAPRPTLVGIEDYRVYGWMKDEHAWSELHTAKIIGMLYAICQDADIPFVMAMASEAKELVTDGALVSWGMWVEGKRHGRDAIRHAVLTAYKHAKSKSNS